MKVDSGTIRIRERFHASPRRIFDAWLDPATAGRWLFATASQPMAHVTIDARTGGSFRFADQNGTAIGECTGRYVELVPNRRVVFTLDSPRCAGPTLVTVAITPRETGCMLELIHAALSGDEARYFEDRWTGILYGLGVELDAMPEHSALTRSSR